MDRTDTIDVVVNVSNETIISSGGTDVTPGVPNTGLLADIGQAATSNPILTSISILILLSVAFLAIRAARRQPNMSLASRRLIDRISPRRLRQLKQSSVSVVPILAVALVTLLPFSTQAVYLGFDIAADKVEVNVNKGQTASTKSKVIATLNNSVDVDYQITAKLNSELPNNLELELANKPLSTSSTTVHSGSGSTGSAQQIPLDLQASVVGDIEPGEYSLGLTISVVALGEEPVITSITPDTGSRTGGNGVTITGSNFYDAAEVDSVFIGSNECQITSVTAATITCTAPASAVDGQQNVRVVTNFGEATLAGGYEYTSEPENALTSLPRIAWEGGPTYYSTANGAKFAKADAAEWDDPSFFPVAVFFGKTAQNHVDSLLDAGINVYAPAENNTQWGEELETATDAGMFVLAHGHSVEQVGDNPKVVGWQISDECEMGYSGCSFPELNGKDQSDAQLAMQTDWVNDRRSLNDGRFMHANFGNGILRTFWSAHTSPLPWDPIVAPTAMHAHLQLMDVSSADKYTYTSPGVSGIIDGWHDAPDWPNGVPVDRAYSYGWQADQMRRFQDPNRRTPIWTFVETARPYLGGEIAGSIELDQIEGAVWSALIHEARGISYFQHNDAGEYTPEAECTGNYSIVECPEVHAKVKSINAKVRSLAPVLNTQSYYNATRTVNGFDYNYYTFNNGTDTMLKAYNGSAYIFAGLGMKCNNETCTSGTADPTGSKTFVVPEGITGTEVEVIGEDRTIPVINGEFVDTFANEYTHHVYRITM